MAETGKKVSKKQKAKQWAIRIVCLVLAVSLVIAGACMLLSQIIDAIRG